MARIQQYDKYPDIEMALVKMTSLCQNDEVQVNKQGTIKITRLQQNDKDSSIRQERHPDAPKKITRLKQIQRLQNDEVLAKLRGPLRLRLHETVQNQP
jgi:hypothetical protein